jgi:hypothetical protein
MKRFIFLFIFILGITHIADAQEVVSNSDRGYYIMNGKPISGIAFERANRVQRAERLVIPQQNLHEARTFYPSDIEEYGFPSARRYISADITLNGSTKKVFLEEVLNLDSIIIYSYSMQGGEFFFLQRGGSDLAELIQDEEEFWNLFRNSSCPEISTYIDGKRKRGLTHKTIRTYQRAYAECNTNLFPKFRFGITAETGLEFKSIRSISESQNPLFSIGAFAQIPIDESFSFRPEVIYRFDAVQLPVVFRYNFNYKKGNRIPYIDLGLLADIKTSPKKEIVLNNGQILANSKTNPFRYGLVLGAGMEFKLTSGHTLYTGIRFRYIEGSVNNEYKEKVKCLTLNVAYGF